MPSIEFWFLLHFIKTTKEFTQNDNIINDLRRYISDYQKNTKRFLEKEKWVANLLYGNKMEKAIKRAKEGLKQKNTRKPGRHFPFTRVHLAISQFDKKAKR